MIQVCLAINHVGCPDSSLFAYFTTGAIEYHSIISLYERGWGRVYLTTTLTPLRSTRQNRNLDTILPETERAEFGLCSTSTPHAGGPKPLTDVIHLPLFSLIAWKIDQFCFCCQSMFALFMENNNTIILNLSSDSVELGIPRPVVHSIASFVTLAPRPNW